MITLQHRRKSRRASPRYKSLLEYDINQPVARANNSQTHFHPFETPISNCHASKKDTHLTNPSIPYCFPHSQRESIRFRSSYIYSGFISPHNKISWLSIEPPRNFAALLPSKYRTLSGRWVIKVRYQHPVEPSGLKKQNKYAWSESMAVQSGELGISSLEVAW